MGLEEKRWIKEMKDETVPKYMAALKEIVGFDLPFEVDWDSYSKDLEGLRNLEYQGMDRINSAFREICRDDIGKDAVKESIKKIILKNIDDPSKKGITLEKGVVTINFALGKDGGYFSDSEIHHEIEGKL
jgi:hypothetical protein